MRGIQLRNGTVILVEVKDIENMPENTSPNTRAYKFLRHAFIGSYIPPGIPTGSEIQPSLRQVRNVVVYDDTIDLEWTE